jgi:transposase InsO family protein
MRWKLAIQQYDFRLQHIPGRLNVVADNMSRLCAKTVIEEEETDSINFAFVLALLLEDHEAVSDAPEPGSMEIDSDSEDCNPDLMAIDGVPNVIETRGQKKGRKAAARQPKVRGPLSLSKVELFSEAHSDAVGHMGVEKTRINVVKLLIADPSRSLSEDPKRLVWQGMFRDIQQFVKECPVCQKLAQTKPAPNTIPFTSSDYLPMRKINVDTMGPFEADAQGNIYIIVVIDCFSRYVGLYPATDVTAVAAGEALLQHVSLFGAPFEILSDKGSQYVNELIKTLCILIGTKKIETVAYSKEENGIVERANKEVLRHLRTILYNRDLKKDWRLCIPLVQRIMNSIYHESIGTSPASIITPYVDLDR